MAPAALAGSRPRRTDCATSCETPAKLRESCLQLLGCGPQAGVRAQTAGCCAKDSAGARAVSASQERGDDLAQGHPHQCDQTEHSQSVKKPSWS